MKPDRPNLDKPTTINQDGSRSFLHPADVSGNFTRWRRLSGLLLIAIYLLLPWIPINGHPAVFLDIITRRFHLFGLTFATQDLWMVFFLITGLGFSLFFITSMLGRVWCGWACPQTVFLEHVYRRIERWIDGDATKRRHLDQQTWDTEKITKRVIKHGLFIIVSGLIAHLFLAYFVSIPQLYQWMTNRPTEHWGSFVFMFVGTAIIYGNFAWFREQLCLIICPYGRLQSALIDDDTLIIGYDEIRGEPRGPAKKEGFGDCINCFRCVQVCPTGIDIRQGLQMECIGCANCIDACNTIMDKVGKPRGLVRYDSLSGLAGKKRKLLRPRVFIYAFLMLVGAGAFTLSAMQLRSANMNVVRMTGSPYFITETGIRNQYMVRVINKTSTSKRYAITVSAEGQTFTVEGSQDGLTVSPLGEEVRPIIVSLQRSDYTGPFELTITLTGPDSKSILSRKAEFIGPDAKRLQESRSQ